MLALLPMTCSYTTAELIYVNYQPASISMSDFVDDGYSSRQELLVPSSQVKELAARLTRGAYSDREKADVLYSYVAGLTYKETVEAQNSGATIALGYGDCMDLSILYSTLLTAAGVDNYVAETEGSNYRAHVYNVLIINKVAYKIDVTNQGSDEKIFKLFNSRLQLKNKHLYSTTYTL